MHKCIATTGLFTIDFGRCFLELVLGFGLEYVRKSQVINARMNAKNVGESADNKPAPPAGLQTIISECMKIYPDQPNPLQVTTVVKFW